MGYLWRWRRTLPKRNPSWPIWCHTHREPESTCTYCLHGQFVETLDHGSGPKGNYVISFPVLCEFRGLQHFSPAWLMVTTRAFTSSCEALRHKTGMRKTQWWAAEGVMEWGQRVVPKRAHESLKHTQPCWRLWRPLQIQSHRASFRVSHDILQGVTWPPFHYWFG